MDAELTIHFQDILDSFDENIALLDGKGMIRGVNHAWNDFYNSNSDGASKIWLGTNYLDICANAHGNDSEEARSAYDGILSVIDGKTACFELEYPCHCPREARWFLLRATPVSNHNDLILVAHINITQRKRAEETVRDQNDLLGVINADLENLIYKVTHDIKSPLNSIKGLINLTKIGHDKGEMDTYLQLMEKSVSHLGEYIHDIMEVSRNTSREVTPKAIRFKHLINEIVSGIQHMEEFRQVRVEVAIDQPAEFKCDQSGLETIFSNLISNAVLYHDASKADPYVSVKVRVKESEAFCVVEDNGQGIDEAQLDKVFEKFYRACTEKQGTGLGLYLVRQSVLKLGGMIDVQSAVGKGTKFSFSLPGLEGTT